MSLTTGLGITDSCSMCHLQMEYMSLTDGVGITVTARVDVTESWSRCH